MKLGLDFHGVIDASPELFAAMTYMFIRNGHEVHVLTGPPVTDKLKDELRGYGVVWTHLFSIVDHHRSLGTEISCDKDGNPWMDSYLWDKTKAEYCERNKIDLHIDDSDVYGYFFKTPYMRFFSKNGNRQRKMKI